MYVSGRSRRGRKSPQSIYIIDQDHSVPELRSSHVCLSVCPLFIRIKIANWGKDTIYIFFFVKYRILIKFHFLQN